LRGQRFETFFLVFILLIGADSWNGGGCK